MTEQPAEPDIVDKLRDFCGLWQDESHTCMESSAATLIEQLRGDYNDALEEAATVVESQCRGMDEGVWCSRHPNNVVSKGASFQPCRMHKNAERIRALKR